MENNYIYGKNPILETLSKSPKRINKIYVQKNFFYDKRLKNILTLAKLNKIIVQETNLQKFTQFFENDVNFQGIIASVSPIEFIELDEFLSIKKDGYKKLVILDNIQDPYNFGSIIRTAVAVGFDGILVSNHRACPITSTVEKISSGAINHISIIKTSSLSASIELLKKQDFWVVATQMQAKDNYYDINYTDMNFAIVMGSEGSGISKTILNKADFTIKIKTNFESLNVSNAFSVIACETLRQEDIKKKSL